MTDETLKPWYAVATPHEDIREGRLAEAIFAADIQAVVRGTAPEVYRDAEEFFRKTHLTAGLSTVMRRVGGALADRGDTGDRIISLQTTFGGGKTHTLVALWHLAKHAARLRDSPHAAELRKAVGGRLPEKTTSVAVFTNQTCDATQGRRVADGMHLRTLWGELAYQLGGQALYERVRENDESQRVPQGIFSDLLEAVSPCLILLDELADYCVGAAAVPVGDTNLADQTVSFIQQLTESAQQVPGTVVVATLPASKYEVARSEEGQEAFVTLEKRFQRLGADVKPVADQEIYEVVRARLFESITPEREPDYPARVAQAYQGMYASHAREVPQEAAKNTYREQIQRAYPFHPLLIDAFHTRWGSHPDFQRTRGVLRLLASIVGDLWKGRRGNTRTQHLIQPCDVRWSVDAVQATLTRLWGAEYESVAAADVIGENSNSGAFDEERGGDYRSETIGTGLASAILLGSFGGQGGRSGFSSKDLKLACSRQGLNWNYSDGALLELEDRCFYLHTARAGNLGKRYWFSTKPTLNKLVVQYRQQIPTRNFSEAIIESIQTETRKNALSGATWRVLVNPAEDLPEQKSLTLLILPPSVAWEENAEAKTAIQKRVKSISARCGGRDRLYRNTLIFLAGTARGLDKLRQAHQEHTALEKLRADFQDRLDDEQRGDLKKRLDTARQAAFEALGPAYTVALRVHGQEVEVCSLADARHGLQEHLGYVWTTLVEDEEWILRRVGPVTLQDTGMIPKEGGWSLKEAVEAFLRFTDKPMVADKKAVTAGLAQACENGLLGIGRGGGLSSLLTRCCRQPVSLDPTEDGVWIIPPFDPEPETSSRDQKQHGHGEGKTGYGHGADRRTETDAIKDSGRITPDQKTSDKRTVRRFIVQGEIPAESWSELFRCFVNPAARMHLKKLGLGVRFEITFYDDDAMSENDERFRNMKESARQLGLKLQIEK